MKRHRRKSSYAGQILHLMSDRLKKHEILSYAASLSFYSLLSFIPLFIIGLVLAGHLIGRNFSVSDQFAAWLNNLFPFIPSGIDSSIYELIENRAIYGWLGLVSLIWTAHMVIAEGEKVIRQIFGVHRKRSLVFSHAIAWGIFLLSVIFFTASFIIGLFLRLVTDNLLPAPVLVYVDPIVNGLTIRYIPAVMVAALVSAAYWLIPRRKVPLLTALAGGLSFTILWELAKKLLIIYMKKVSYMSLIYGSLTTFMMFLLFIYYSSLLFIVIAEFAACTLDVD